MKQSQFDDNETVDEPTIKYITDDGTVCVRTPKFMHAKKGHVVFGLDGEKVRIPWRRVVETREPYSDTA